MIFINISVDLNVEKVEFQQKIGFRLKKIRSELGLSQRQLALNANKDPQSLERVENGKSCPTVFFLNEICVALNISLADFFKDFE